MQMLDWVNQFSICAFLDSQHHIFSKETIECLVAGGAISSYQSQAGSAFQELGDFFKIKQDWLFGHFSYDMKNEVENLHSDNPDHIGFPDVYFFVPEIILLLKNDQLSIGSLKTDHEEIYRSVTNWSVKDKSILLPDLQITQQVDARHYIQTVEALREHIHKGDCYEINYCIEFFAKNAQIDPLSIYQSLTSISPNPFSSYYKLDNKYCLCSSPERFLKKTGKTLMSQPMKGTLRRGLSATHDDESEREILRKSEKDRAENVMIVDLVRNDLSRVCEEGSVKVDELFGIYSFPNLHQMVSTISGQIRENVSWIESIKSCFPMGSMTGAPKKRVLELIEQYESSRRGLFSGTIGYITPEEDFDFNVIIRSILYNSDHRYLSYHTGSAITFQSDPQAEYEECLLKGELIKRVLA